MYLFISLSLHVLQKPGMDIADAYVTFVRHSQDMLRDKVNEEMYIERLFDVSKSCFFSSSENKKKEFLREGGPVKCDMTTS